MAALARLLVIGFVMISLLFLVYGDRKIWAAVQMRRGPNVVGTFGLLQTVADALKYVVKEVVIPSGSDKAVFMLAPILIFVPSFLVWSVIPFDLKRWPKCPSSPVSRNPMMTSCRSWSSMGRVWRSATSWTCVAERRPSLCSLASVPRWC
mgnify:CR=1 FL=1